jgi:hypothetical protein
MTLMLYNLLTIAVALDAAASTFAAFWIFRLHHRFSVYVAATFFAVAIKAWTMVITLSFSPMPADTVLWIVALRIVTRLISALTMIALTLYLLGYLNGKRNR